MPKNKRMVDKLSKIKNLKIMEKYFKVIFKNNKISNHKSLY